MIAVAGFHMHVWQLEVQVHEPLMDTPEEHTDVHVVSAAHLRVDVADADTTSYSRLVQGGCESHTRSDVAVGAAISYCEALHTVSG